MCGPCAPAVPAAYLGDDFLAPLLLGCGGGVEVLVDEAGREAVAQGLDAHLVQGQEGHEPRGLKGGGRGRDSM